MAGSPMWKVYKGGLYIASCRYPEDAAVVVAANANAEGGVTIRYGHGLTVWTEGKDGQAGESYDQVAETCWTRVNAHQAKAYAKAYGSLPGRCPCGNVLQPGSAQCVDCNANGPHY